MIDERFDRDIRIAADEDADILERLKARQRLYVLMGGGGTYGLYAKAIEEIERLRAINPGRKESSP